MDELRSGRDETRATVVASLPNARFRLRCDDGTELIAHLAGDSRVTFTRLLPGDVVLVEVSPFDRTKARIAGRPAVP
jgi:translation initiation factor IF-1